MPIQLHIKPEHNLVILVHVGTIPDDEFFEFYKDLFTKSQYDLSMNLLVDLRQTDSTPRSSEMLSQFAKFLQSRLANMTAHPKAAVIAPGDISFGLARMFGFFSDSGQWDFEVFREVDDAFAWLHLPTDLMDDTETES